MYNMYMYIMYRERARGDSFRNRGAQKGYSIRIREPKFIPLRFGSSQKSFAARIPLWALKTTVLFKGHLFRFHVSFLECHLRNNLGWRKNLLAPRAPVSPSFGADRYQQFCTCTREGFASSTRDLKIISNFCYLKS